MTCNLPLPAFCLLKEFLTLSGLIHSVSSGLTLILGPVTSTYVSGMITYKSASPFVKP